jgi:ectoine hydroxylase-related dioxygenase (phytanoyl-CoA dioxygenase family)
LFEQSLHPMTASNELLERPEALRARLAEDGYLLIRGILDLDLLHSLRADITRILADLGWIDAQDPLRAIAVGLPFREGDPGFDEAMRHIGKLESLHAFKHQPAAMDLMRVVLDDTAFPHPLGIVRLTFPETPETTTPPHQDYPNNQGSVELTACWMPLGDVPGELGGLAVLRGSHRYGRLPLQFHLGPGSRAAVLSSQMSELQWVSTDFNAGDVLVFPALTVHSARVNRTADRMRISCDFRYQKEGQELTQSCLEPHLGGLTWDEIYAGWESTDLQYYWRDKDYSVVPWDPTMHDLPESSFLEAYKQVVRFEAERQARHKAKQRS